jgi:GT2 family glycosyltransferase
MISVICVYNNEQLFQETLLKSLNTQSISYDLVAIDNTQGKFTSAAQALNYGASKTQPQSSCFVFVHQDVKLCSPDFLEDVETTLALLPDLGIAGVAGNVEGDKNFFSSITHGTPPTAAGRKIRTPIAVMTVDECFIAIPRHIFEQYRFDEGVCDGWHLYAVEYCLRVKLAGFCAYILPAPLYHCSSGMLGIDYFIAFEKVRQRYKQSYRKIYTTCGCWSTRMPGLIQMGWYFGKQFIYLMTNRLAERGFIPEWILWKKRKRLQQNND